MTVINKTRAISASASSGPASVYLDSVHYEGHDLEYSGGPIPITGRESDGGPLAGILPNGITLNLSNFSWEQTPPNVPMISYTFMFSGNIEWGI